MKVATLIDALWVGAGGFAGSVLRYAVSGLVHRLLPFATFPFGTLAVNAMGCLVIGVLGGISEGRQAIGHDLRLFLFLGLLGGFTTFSSFGYETLALLRDGENLRAAANVALQLAAGLGLAWAGYSLAVTR